MMRRRRWVFAAGAAALALAGCACAPSSEVRQALAPTGVLRIAVYPGSPTSLVRAAPPDEMRGMAVDIGRELARRLGVASEVVVFQRVAEVLDALKKGQVDFTITNATPARAQDVDFTPPLVSLELGYLSLMGSRVQTLDDVDQPGVRIGVSQGSTSQGVLGRELRRSTVVPAPNLQAAAAMLQRQELDAFATNKAILFEMADGLPGARVLKGRWGLEHLAIAVPQGRRVAASYLQELAETLRREGLVRRAAERAGLRGTADPA